MKVAGIQHDIVWEQPQENFARLAPMIASAADAGARLVVLTEMFSTGFSMHTDTVAEPENGPSVQFMCEQAARRGVWVCGSVPIRPAGRDLPFNQLVVAAPDASVHRYNKIHPFTYGREHEYYSAGHEHVTVDVEGTRASLFVCYDLRFPDEFWARSFDTDCYVVVANWPASRRSHWRALLVARAIENQTYVVGVNRVGRGGTLEYAGDSLVVDPLGEILADAGSDETIITAEVDPAVVQDVRTKFPFITDRR